MRLCNETFHSQQTTSINHDNLEPEIVVFANSNQIENKIE